jgi:MFS family permease
VTSSYNISGDAVTKSIAPGLGTIFGSAIIGNLLNRDYALTEKQYILSSGLPQTYKLPKKDLPDDFPIERTRLRHLWWIVGLFILSTSGYGWTLSSSSFTSKPGSIALPLFLQFVIAATSNAVFAVNQTLLSDLCPGRGASSSAINNLVRCSMGAIGVAFIEKMIAALGVGPSFTALGLITLACVPLLVLEWYWGMEWRRQRAEKTRAMQKAKGIDLG